MFPKTRLRKSKQPWRQQVALWFWSKSLLSFDCSSHFPPHSVILSFLRVKMEDPWPKGKKCLQTLLLSLNGIKCGSMTETELTGTQPGQTAALLFLCSLVCSRLSDPLGSKYDLQKQRLGCQVHLSIGVSVQLFTKERK